MQEIVSAPSAGALIESLRDIGYTFESALSDIVDNSVTAHASNIAITLDASIEDPWVAVRDNGIGMSRRELLIAMKPGSYNPLHARNHADLGRFGLGLKIASFSQCRRLTVITRQEGELSGARWDLDYVSQLDDWILQVLDWEEIEKLPAYELLAENGTVVLWENLDRLRDSTGRTAPKDHLYERLESAEKHLALVFHRYLNGERPFRKVNLTINSRYVEPFDPFNSRHPATIRQREEEILFDGYSIKVQPFILPHHKKTTHADWEKYGGDAGYLKNQGFYVYRAGRLIIHGTWFRLAKQSELTKLARVRIDM
ncbi:MAG: ATP-binding protein, partial [Candidatus Thiodiazotropha sp. (ex Lucinoma borealis)]|nr:ATP-binding protein [Candidatus Thiodiazotropha sp. (ex Lucinoma borealis)]